MGFHWSLSDSKSPQVSRTRLRILAVLSNAVIWIVTTRPPTSKSPRPFNNPLVIVPKAPITIGTIVTFMFHSFFSSLAKSRYLSFFLHSFSFILWLLLLLLLLLLLFNSQQVTKGVVCLIELIRFVRVFQSLSSLLLTKCFPLSSDQTLLSARSFLKPLFPILFNSFLFPTLILPRFSICF